MERQSLYWTSLSHWTQLYASQLSLIGQLQYQEPRPQHPEVAVSKTYARIERMMRADPDGESDKTIRSEQDAHCQISPLHANILKYFFCLNTAESTTIYMEYADYGDGEKLIETLKTYGRYNEAQVLDMMRQLTGALAAMHKEGWAHRDIKPANLFIFQAGLIKLGDFGCAKRIFDPDNPNTVLGTEAYMAPEITSAVAQNCTMSPYDPFMCDIYSLGSTFFTLATLRLVSEFGDVLDETNEILFQQFISSALLELSFSQDLAALLSRMLATKAQGRPKADEVLADIQRLQGRHQSIRPPPSAPQPVNCLKCHTQKPSDQFLTLNCGDRMCHACYALGIEAQAHHLMNLKEFKCPQCASPLNPFLITANQNLLSRTTQQEISTVTFLSIESPCPGCKHRVHPMFVRGIRIKKVKPYQVKCSCKVKFCSFCSHKGKHRKMLILPTTHCPFFDPLQYL